MADREEAARPSAERGSQLGGAPGDGAPRDEQDGFMASVVLATVGRPERLRRVIDAVIGDAACAEVIVVVDGPDERSLAELRRLVAERPTMRFMSVEKGGQMAALDAGILAAKGDVIVLLDDDVILNSGTVCGHVRRQREGERLVVLGPMPVDLGSSGTNAATRLYAAEYLDHVDALLSGRTPVLDALWTGNMSLRRADCIRVGMRSASFREHYHEDRDLGYRLADAGFTGVFDPALKARHLHHRSNEAFLRDSFRAGRAQASLHRERADKLGEFTPAQLIADLPLPLRWFVKLAAGSRLTESIAKAMMAAGDAMATLRLAAGELAAAKLARRVMMYRGALDGSI